MIDVSTSAAAPLSLRVHSKTFLVADLAQATARFQKYRGTRSSRFFPAHVSVVDVAGNEVARISYNGRVWPPRDWQAGDQPLFEADGTPFVPEKPLDEQVATNTVDACANPCEHDGCERHGDFEYAELPATLPEPGPAILGRVIKDRVKLGPKTRRGAKTATRVHTTTEERCDCNDCNPTPDQPQPKDTTVKTKTKKATKAKRTTTKTTKARAPKGEGPTDVVRALYKANPKKGFAEIVAMAVEKGVNKNTAAGALVRLKQKA